MPHPLLPRTALGLSLAMLAVPGPGSAALPAPAPAPAPSGGVAGPPDGLIAPPPPVQQRPLPQPRTFPAPAPAPTPTPAPQPSQVQRPRPTQSVPQVRPEQPAAPAQSSAERPAPAPQGDLSATPAPPPIEPLPPVEDQAIVEPPETTPTSATSDDAAFDQATLAALGGAALALLAGVVWYRRRSRASAAAEDAGAAPLVERTQPTTARQTPPVRPARAAPESAPTALGRRADLAIAFEALSAQSTLMNLRLRYAVTIRNTGSVDAEPVTVRIGLFAGAQINPQSVAQWFTVADELPHHEIGCVIAGGEHRFEGELAAPLDALNPITVDGRVLAIPLVAVDARYNHGAGAAPIDGQSARAFVIGRDPGREGAKLAPFRLDQGPTSFTPLGQRDTGISKVA